MADQWTVTLLPEAPASAPPAGGPPQYSVLNPQGVQTGVTTDPSLVSTQPGATVGPQITAPPPGAPPPPPAIGTRPGETKPDTKTGSPAGGDGNWTVTLLPEPAPQGAPGPAAQAPQGAPQGPPRGPPGAMGAPMPPVPMPPPQAAPGYMPVPFMQPGMSMMQPPAQAPQQAPPIPPPSQMPVQGVGPTAAMPPAGGQSQVPFQPPGTAQMVRPPLQPTPTGATPTPSTGFWGTVGRESALGGEKFLEGIPLGVTGIADLANRGLGAIGLGIYPQGALSNAVEQAYQGLGGLEPQSSGEQMWANTASAMGGVVPSLAVGGALQAARLAPAVARALLTSKALQFAGAGGGGVAGTVAQQAGMGPGAQFAAALLGTMAGHGAASSLAGAGRGVVSGFSLGREAGRQRAAGQVLMQQSGMDPNVFRQRLQAVPSPTPGAVPKTTGMATQAPGLMVYEKAVRATPEGAGIREIEAQRARATGQILQNLRSGTPMTTAERGQALRHVFAEQGDAMRTRSDQLYGAARAVKGEFPTDAALRGVQKVAADYYGPGSRAPAAFRSIAQQILDRPQTASAEWLRNMDQQIGNEIGKARVSGDNQLAAALGELRNEVGSINPTPEYQEAKDFYRRYKEVTGRDETGASASADILRTDRYGNPMRQDAQVMARAVKDPASVKQVLNMGDEAIAAAQASGASPAQVQRMIAAKDSARGLMREHFLDNAERTTRLTGDVVDASGTAHPVYSPDKWRKFIGDNRQVADQLFSRADQGRLQELTNILADNADAARTAKAPGSDTAQNLAMIAGKGSPTMAHVLGAITRGRVTPGSPIGDLVADGITTVAGAHLFGPIGAVLGHRMGEKVMQALLGHSDEMIRSLVHEAAADPEMAKLLVSKATPAVMQRVLQRSQQRGGMLWGLLQGAGRGVIQAPAPAAAGTAVQYPQFAY